MTPQDLFLHRQIDEYKIEALLGRGGMARVYRGTDVRLKRAVAIKIIDSPYLKDTAYLVRFEREAQIIAQLSHPNIIQLYRYGEMEGFLYIVMQYIDGSDLHSVLNSYRADGEFLEPHEINGLFEDICGALDYIHSQGVIHRDIKPSNILLTRTGQAILSDFGLALVARVGTLGEIFGSPQYIAPEQALSSANAEARSDLYSAGVILYEILTGQLPFQSKDPLDLAMAHVREAVPSPRSLRPEINPETESVLLKALSKDPEDRYPSGAALVAALRAALPEKPAEQSPPQTISHLTIPERVNLQLNADSLTPLTALPPSEPPETRPISPPQAARLPSNQRLVPWLVGAGILGFIVVAGLSLALVLAGMRWINRFGGANASPIAGATLPAGSAIALRLVKDGDESLFLVNQGNAAFPLETLQLANTPSKVYGEEWQVPLLKSGECVAVWKNRNGTGQPAGLECHLVGLRVVRDGPQRFWTSPFNVYYQGQFLGDCQAESAVCEFTVPATP